MNRRSFLKSLSLLFFVPALAAFQKKNNKVKFLHGVASGDPTDKRVVIWTRITPEKFNVTKAIKYQISLQKSFKSILEHGLVFTNKRKDFTVKADINLSKYKPGTKFFYRFICEDVISPVGITNTLPQQDIEKYKIAIFSCSNHPAGFFNVYKDAAEDKSIDLNIHLGDYIYEYEDGGYATEDANKLGRIPIPENEVKTLNEYRLRHSQYKTDEDLQALHQSRPMICIWDDHEISNDAWQNGAENHQKNESNFYFRKKSALQAYYEWMPVREKVIKQRRWEKFKIGNLINLLILDTRLSSRDKQVMYSEYINDGNFDKESFLKDLNKKSRSLLGNEQLNFVKQKSNKNCTWNLFGQQVLLSKVVLPPLPSFVLNELPENSKYLKYINNLNLPYNTDSWDGYPAERERFLNILRKHSSNNVFLAGDTHNCWAANVKNNTNNFVGVEFATPSVSSPGGSDEFKGLDVRPIEAAITQVNKNLVWTNFRNRGYLTLELRKEFGLASFIGVNTVKKKSFTRSILKNIYFKPGKEIT